MLSGSLFYILGLSLGLASDVPTSPYCTGQCAKDYAVGYAYDARSWVAKDVDEDPYWNIPPSSGPPVPGNLIKWQHLSAEADYANWAIPGGTTMSRFLYWTEDANGKVIPASAFALLPFAPPEGQKRFRTLVWAHGTAGHSRMCAPSNHKNLYYDWAAPYSFAQAGYAVIAPDYAGLGTKIPQQFMYVAGFSHAADAAFSLVAARKALGKLLTDEWVVVGQSEGGMTAWRTNERLAMDGQDALLKAGKFLGSVSIAPAMRPLDLLSESLSRPDGRAPDANVAVYILQSLEGLYPDEIRLQDYLTEKGLGLAELSKQSCVYGGYYAFSSFTTSEIFRNTSWLTSHAAADWRKKHMAEGPHALAAPLLVIQGSADTLVPLNATREEFNKTCRKYPGSRAQLNIYHGQDHDVVTGAAQPDYLAWISARFEGKPAKTGCSSSQIHPFFKQFNSVATVYEAKV